MLIIGGGLAGLSTGTYALANGWEVTIVEHNLALGGVCTAWKRGPYTVDGCIHWLTGGAFFKVYEELRICPPVAVRTLEHFSTIRDGHGGWSVEVGRDLAAMGGELRALSPADGEAIDDMLAAAEKIADLAPPIDRPQELMTMRDQLRWLWELRGELGILAKYRDTVGAWTERLAGDAVRRALRSLVPGEAPMFFLLMMLGYLGRGWLSRPVGGTAAFLEALCARYQELGGAVVLNTTVDEVLVEGDRAVGVRTSDGSMLRADVVVSTSSAPETVLRLLGGRYGADALHERMKQWKLFEPIVLASWGVSRPLTEVPSTIAVSGMSPVSIAGRRVSDLVLRIFNDEPSVAPKGHTVVQALMVTDYGWWATRGRGYGDAKAAVAAELLGLVERQIPGIGAAVEMSDVATPLTYWRSARSWRGAFEGWMPAGDTHQTHVPKTLPGLERFYMAGQWVEPGGGVPAALMSGRQLVQILCAQAGRRFVVSP